MRGDSRIRSEHSARDAYVYVRQSSPGQVLKNTESGRRQRDLVGLAQSLGWPLSRIRVLDDDQGKSGQTATNRSAFKQMAGAVSAGEVGIVIGLQISRVGRNAAELFPLIEVCGLTRTLVADEQGVYDPNDSNDRMMLGLKVTISEAEVAGIRAQLQGARWSKAGRGELRRSLPAGYVWDENGQVAMDPDERVRSAFRSLFSRFRETGSALGLARAWNRDGLKFPTRPSRGRWGARVVWKELGTRHCNHVLNNAFYAGAYFYGARRARTVLDPQTLSRKTVIQKVAMEDWEVLIREDHEGYISWEDFLRNQEILRENWNLPQGGAGVPRSGGALLQGIAFCGACGRRLTMRYSGRRQEATYACAWHTNRGEFRYCLSIQALRVDPWVQERILEAIAPLGLEAAIAAVEEIERRSEDLRQQWEHRIEQAKYEAGLAQRRYEAVDPDNRLVAGNLEREWEGKLRDVEALSKEYQERCALRPVRFSDQDRDRVRALAKDLPRLWRAKSTKPSDRKRILRLLIKEIWLSTERRHGPVCVKIHWQTGAVTEGEIEAATTIAQRKKLPESVVTRVRELRAESKTSGEIADQLNAEGRRTAVGTRFTRCGINYVLRSRGITGPDEGANPSGS